MPGKLRLPGFEANPIDQDWVRLELAKLKTHCEWPNCTTQAVFAWEGRTSISYVCDPHLNVLQRSHAHSVWLDQERWEQFRDHFDFIRQVEKSGGELLRRVLELPAAEAAAQKQAEKDTRKAQRAAVAVLRKNNKEIKVGTPDDELAATRGVQAPLLGDIQLVFRVPEPVLPNLGALPKLEESQPVIPVGLF